VRTLAAAVLGLLLLEPSMAWSVGFALSVAATAGILLVAPSFRAALARWLPGWLADAVAIPTAAQLACGPPIAAISGQVRLIAVLANLLVAPAIGPATVLGLLGGLIGLVWPAAG
jgi:competence protein ComEC